MALSRQILIALGLVAAALALWAAFVPSAAPLLARLGIPVAGDAAAPGGPGGPGGPPGGGFGGPGGPSLVIGAPVTEGRANARIAAIGDGRSLRSVVVTPRAEGRIVAIEVAPGAEVATGQPLVRLDGDLEAIALERAELGVADAEATFQRISELRSRGAATDVQEREARLALDRARLERRDAALALEQRTVLAPIDGVVGLLDVEIGMRVASDDPIASIEDRSSLLVEFRVPERAAAALSIGAEISATPLARPELLLDGAITALDNRVDPASRTLRVQAELPNADGGLRAGMAFAVEIAVPGEPFPAVDPLAIQWGAEGAYVWVEREGKAARVPVRIVQRNAESVLVAAEIAPGERVVTEGLQRLRPGSELRFLGDPPPADAPAGAPRADGAALGRAPVSGG